MLRPASDWIIPPPYRWASERRANMNPCSSGEALAECLQASDCVMVQRHPARDCLREPLAETLPTKCRQLAKGLGECRRGMLDMRKRFRGNMAISMKQLEKGDISEDGARPGGYQLYGGRSAFGGIKGETSGNEKDKQDWREAENEEYRRDTLAKRLQGGGKS